ncbi:TPA: tail assembly protein, partial [Klebsiella quasipneumoniae]
MQEVMTRIELSGPLGKRFGKIHHRLISCTHEAGEALAKTIPGFEKFMISSEERGLTYAVFKGDKNIGVDDLGFPVTGEVIRIIPVIIGSKKAGALQTILGAVLVVVGVIVGYASGGTLSAVGYGAAKFGAAMMLGGVVQMLSPQPAGLARKES